MGRVFLYVFLCKCDSPGEKGWLFPGVQAVPGLEEGGRGLECASGGWKNFSTFQGALCRLPGFSPDSGEI